MEIAGFVLLAAVVVLAAPVLALIALTQIRALERRLRRLEDRLGIAAAGPSRRTAASPTMALTDQPRAEPPSPASRPARVALESQIAGRWLNRVGIVALLLSVAFFLKYAFDNDWVGDRGRVAIGLFSGATLLIYSQWLLKRGYRYFSDGMAGLGAGVLYLSLFAAWDFYQLLAHGVAFAGMTIVTAAMLTIAVGRNSQAVAFQALAGGFLTPALLNTGQDAQVVLFTYLGILNAGILGVARARTWRSLAPAAFAATLVYFWDWTNTYYSSDRLGSTLLFASLLFAEFSAIPLIQSRRGKRLHWDQALLVLLNSALYLLALHHLLYQDYRWALTFAVLLLAAIHLVVARSLLSPSAPGAGQTHGLARLIYGGLALTLVTLAIPIRLEGKWITMAWAVEGAVLVWSGFRARLPWLRWAGTVLLGAVVARLLLFSISAERFVLNPRFATMAVTVACLALAFYFFRRGEEAETTKAERRCFAALGLSIHPLAVWALSMEVWDAFGRFEPSLGVDTALAQQLALSLVWTTYATVLMAAGVRQASPALRWQGLALFGLVVGKVFFYDLASLERVYRIISFLVLGLLLIVVSFLYQRKLFNEDEK